MRSGDRLDALPILAGVDGQPNERTAPPARKGNPSSNSTTRAMSIRTGRILWSSGASRPAPAALAATRRGLSAWSNDSVPTGSVATLHELGVAAGEAYGDLKSLGTRKDGAWVWTTFAERAARADALGNALASYGVERGDRVAVISKNREEFVATMYGAYAAGAAHVPMYEQQKPEEWEYILNDSEAKVVFVSTAALLPSAREAARKYGKKVLCFEDLEAGSEHNFAEALDYGATLDGAAAAAQRPAAADLASLIYTSGTTGNPKAVELTHESARSVCEMMHARIPLNESTVLVSYLPLSHIAALGIDVYSAIFCGATVHFADADALRGSLKTTLLAARPTLFFGVPRVWEKMAAAMQATAAKTYATSKAKQVIGTAAKAVGAAWWDPATPEVARGALALPMGLFKVLAFKKIRKACGLDRCELLYTGAAPLSAATADYLKSVDMPLLEVFGMSESCGAIAVSGPLDGARPAGSCGRPLPNGHCEIAPDGEVLWRGGNVMRGYAGRAEATAAALDDGYLRTGDLGELVGGFLRITGRKKDLIITAGGENVAPAPVEERFCDALGGHAVLVGDRRKFLSLLLAPPEGGAAPAPDAVKAALDAYNAAAMSRAQRVQKVSVLPAPFSVETEELTPTMKLKRAFVIAKYQSQVDDMYRDGPTIAYGAAVGESN
mmetsp:Transcript_35412/g.119895  ORF Transcript_35412/g.119895 Transcript_35412/m.119895 type:complete len:669 (-) Transcript_35412:69-2075(-)